MRSLTREGVRRPSLLCLGLAGLWDMLQAEKGDLPWLPGLWDDPWNDPEGVYPGYNFTATAVAH